MTNEIQTEKQEVQTTEGVERTRSVRCYVPKVDIFPLDDGIVILAEMPGVDENNVDITLEKDVLTIKGFVTFEEPEGYELTYGEYAVGDFQRSFTLPDEIDRNNIKASVSDGVLRLSLAKAPEAQTRKITVTAG